MLPFDEERQSLKKSPLDEAMLLSGQFRDARRRVSYRTTAANFYTENTCNDPPPVAEGTRDIYNPNLHIDRIK
jgi:hypothetical protein